MNRPNDYTRQQHGRRRQRGFRAGLLLSMTVTGTTSSTMVPDTFSEYDLSALETEMEDPFGGLVDDRATPVSERRQVLAEKDEGVDDAWQSKDEWWKDPLALFDDEEEDDNEIADFYASSPSAEEEPLALPADAVSGGDDMEMLMLPTDDGGEEVEEEEEEEEDNFGFLDVEDEEEENEAVAAEEATPDIEEAALDQAEEKESEPEPPGAAKSTSQIPKTISSPSATLAPLIRAARSARTNAASFATPAAFSAFLPKAKSVLVGTPAVKVFAAVAIGKAFFDFVVPSLRKGPSETEDYDDDYVQSNTRYDRSRRKKELDEEEDVYDDEEEEDLYDNEEEDEVLDMDEEDEDFDEEDEEVERKEVQEVPKPRRRPPPATELPPLPTVEGPRFMEGLMSFLRRERYPPAKVLMEEVLVLRSRVEEAEDDKTGIEGEYEQASWKLQEAQSELTALKQTTKYLQAQLRDNEEMMERVVSTERRKAKDELARMKEAMVKVVEREREAMRDEFMKQAAELQSMWKDKDPVKPPYEFKKTGARA